ncbi:kinesin-like protein KIN-14H [Zingiber officinale]|uniref:kinesin-like protein KIN-14H n=1 Tax=Zingiber officinale TaxID=94328 RepID=UPI001C4DD028|nr:kinesin-like protein KIN-14H [Zingiber officinale]
MSSRSQMRPPVPAHPAATRSPSSKKENLDEATPIDKRRVAALGKMAGPNHSPRVPRQVLSSVNAGSTTGDQNNSCSDAGSTAGIEFGSREDVETLLREKMKGKNKNDFKGKSEQMTEYIKKLRICIRWYMELEDDYLAEQEKLRNELDSEEKRHRVIETDMRATIDQIESAFKELQIMHSNLQDGFRKEETDRLTAVKFYENERKTRVEIETSRDTISKDLEKITQEKKCVSDQLKMLQETNRRLQEYNASLQQYNSNLQNEANKNGETISRLHKEKSAIMESLTSTREHASSLKNQLDSSRSSQQDAVKQKDELKKEISFIRTEFQQVRDDRDHLLAQVQSLTMEVAEYKEISGKSSKSLETITARAALLEEACFSQSGEIKLLRQQLTFSNEKLKRADLTAIEVISEYEEQQKTVIDLQDRLVNAELQIVEAEKIRKKLHNTILELKGNIRVFCRVRPLLHDTELGGTDGSVVSYPTSIESLGSGIDMTNNAQMYSFTFDKVFNQGASQGEVFEEISQLIQSALDGYKVCIFAYGQTGSGKTYTMMGNTECPEQKGLIPRSLEQIFQTSQSLQSQGWKYKMQASMLEIYNETVRDLLSPSRPTSVDTSGGLTKQYSIKHDSNGNAVVSDLTIVNVCSSEHVSFLLQQASMNRSVGKTQMNEQSSRSHFVFTLKIVGVNERTEQQIEGILNLIDLAGSERLAKSGSTGDRLKETQAINKSLSALSDVIFSIAKKEDHVPFRNSKLTYLLQPCLGGDSKTLMFVNISPEATSVGESLCSLRFAARVNSCEIGIPRRQTQT